MTIAFHAEYFAEEVNFAIRTRREVIAMRAYRRPHVVAVEMVERAHGQDGAGIRVGSPPLAAGSTLYMELDLDGLATLDDFVAWGPWGDPSIFV